jgi:fructose-specific phosphotransferase system IIA component
MNLMDILTPECIRVPLASTGKQAVIDEVVDLLVEQGKVRDGKALKAAVWSREQTRTTGIGAGLAIPHGKCTGLDTLAIAIGKPAEPIDFEALDNKPVSLVVLLASPPDRTSDHIQALARISKLMADESFREQIYAATTAEEVYSLIKERNSSV